MADGYFDSVGADPLDLVPTDGYDFVRKVKHDVDNVHHEKHTNRRKEKRPKDGLIKHEHNNTHWDAEDVRVNEDGYDYVNNVTHTVDHTHRERHRNKRKQKRPKDGLVEHVHNNTHYDKEDFCPDPNGYDYKEQHVHKVDHVHAQKHDDQRNPTRPKDGIVLHKWENTHVDLEDVLSGKVTGLKLEGTAPSAAHVTTGPALLDGNPATHTTVHHRTVHIHEKPTAIVTPGASWLTPQQVQVQTMPSQQMSYRQPLPVGSYRY